MKQPDRTSSGNNLEGLPELTLRGVLLGILITVVFTASNVYLGLKVGLTFSSAIPAAVISMAVLKRFADSNILENNMVQAQASAAGTLSAVIFVLPGLLMMGYWADFHFWQTLLLCACGGCLGVLFTIPLRRAMVVNSDLPYPEGRAAAEILKVGSRARAGKAVGGGGMKEILGGGLIAAIINLCSSGFQVISGDMGFWFNMGKGTSQLDMGFSMALLGAGYLIGIASGVAMLVGLVISWGVYVPYLTATMHAAAGVSAHAFASDLWAHKVRFAGAGAIGIAAIWTLGSMSKPIIDGVRISIDNMKGRGAHADAAGNVPRTERDMSPTSIGIVLLVVLVGLIFVFHSFMESAVMSTGLSWTLVAVGTLVAVVMGFLVAAACGYMAGLIGTSASPISGIGILGIIISSLVVLAITTASGYLSSSESIKFAMALALFMTSVVVSIAAISNDNLQDLKTGQLVNATPAKLQIALLIGCVVGAIAIAPVLDLLYQAYGFVGAMPRAGMDPSQALSAPQAILMTMIAKGIFGHNLEWNYVLSGVGVGVLCIIVDQLLKRSTGGRLHLPPLAIGMGMYLPPSLETPIVVGTIMSYFVLKAVEKRAARRQVNEADAREDLEQCSRRGVLYASGLIVGESLMGVLIAIIIMISVTAGGSAEPLKLGALAGSDTAGWLGLIVFVAMVIYFARLVWTAHVHIDREESSPTA